MAQPTDTQLTDFNEYCNQELSKAQSSTISKEKGRRLIHYLKTKDVLPPLPDSRAPGPADTKTFIRFSRRHNFTLVNDPLLGIVDELRVRESDVVSIYE